MLLHTWLPLTRFPFEIKAKWRFAVSLASSTLPDAQMRGQCCAQGEHCWPRLQQWPGRGALSKLVNCSCVLLTSWNARHSSHSANLKGVEKSDQSAADFVVVVI